MGNWTGTQLRPQRSLKIVNEGAQAAAAAGLGVVHLIDEDDAGNIGFFSESPDALGDGLDAGLGVDDDDSGFDGEERGAGFVGEHVEAGRVDKIDFDALPLGKGDGVLHGNAAGHFFFVVGGGGRAVFNAALGGSHFGGMQQSGNEGGFAAVRMPHYSYIADLTSLVRFHGLLLPPAVGQPPSAGPRQQKGAGLGLRDWKRAEVVRNGRAGSRHLTCAGIAVGRPAGRSSGRIAGIGLPVGLLPLP